MMTRQINGGDAMTVQRSVDGTTRQRSDSDAITRQRSVGDDKAEKCW